MHAWFFRFKFNGFGKMNGGLIQIAGFPIGKADQDVHAGAGQGGRLHLVENDARRNRVLQL